MGEKSDSGTPDDASTEEATLERLYRDLFPRLVARLRRIYGPGPPDPEDLAQTAFARAMKDDGWEKMSNPMAYLFRIAVNAGLDARQRDELPMAQPPFV